MRYRIIFLKVGSVLNFSEVAVYDQNVDCHHENGADGVEGARKEVFHPGVKINGF